MIAQCTERCCHFCVGYRAVCASMQTAVLPFQYLALSHMCQPSECCHSSIWLWAICASLQSAVLPFQYLALSHMCQSSECSVAIPVSGTEPYVPAFKLQCCHSSIWHWAICASLHSAVLPFQYLALSHMCQHAECSVAKSLPKTNFNSTRTFLSSVCRFVLYTLHHWDGVSLRSWQLLSKSSSCFARKFQSLCCVPNSLPLNPILQHRTHSAHLHRFRGSCQSCPAFRNYVSSFYVFRQVSLAVLIILHVPSSPLIQSSFISPPQQYKHLDMKTASVV